MSWPGCFAIHPSIVDDADRAKGAIALEDKQYGEALELIRAAPRNSKYRQQSRQDLVEMAARSFP
jgi:hypothetical protein